MWVVALYAVSYCWRVNPPFNGLSVFFGVAGNAEGARGICNQLDAGYILGDSNFVTTGAAHGDCGMDELAFGFIFVAGDAGGRIGLGVKRNRMLGRGGTAGEQENDQEAGQGA